MDLQPGDLLLCYTDALSEARDPSGELIGTDGLLKLIEPLDRSRPEALIDALLAAVSTLDPKNLDRDDVTAMLMRPTPRRRKPNPLRRLQGMFRFVAAIVALRPALPDWMIANVGGLFVPALSKVPWRKRGKKLEQG